MGTGGADLQTLQVYDERAEEFAARHHSTPPASLERLYQAIRGFFHPGAPTADIGCGSGRDTAWLVANGYPAVGYDVSIRRPLFLGGGSVSVPGEHSERRKTSKRDRSGV